MGETDSGIWVLFWWVGPCSVNFQSNFLLMGGAVFPLCCLAWGQTMIRGNEDKENLLQKELWPHCCVQCPWPCSRPLPTHASAGDSWTLTGKSGSVSCENTALFSWILVSTSFCLCPPSLFPQSCGSSIIKSHWPQKSNSLGVLSPFTRSPGWEICCES